MQIKAGERTTFTVQLGGTVTLNASTGASGSIVRLGSSVGTEPYAPVPYSGSVVTLGPYDEVTRFAMQCDVGSFTYDITVPTPSTSNVYAGRFNKTVLTGRTSTITVPAGSALTVDANAGASGYLAPMDGSFTNLISYNGSAVTLGPFADTRIYQIYCATGFMTCHTAAYFGPPPPAILFPFTTIPEGSAIGTVVGPVTVTNGNGSYTITIKTDPDSKFTFNTGSVKLAAGVDYESKQAHSITLKADNGVDTPLEATFTVPITNVLEVTLGALSFSSTSWNVGAPASGVINGASTGSTIVATGLPAGLTINGTNRTWAWDGTGSVGSVNFSLTETHADATNSGRVSNISGSIGNGARILLAVIHSDSGGRGVLAAQRGGLDAWPSWLEQWVSAFSTPGTADNGFPLTPGFTQQTPIQAAVGYESVDYLSPYESAVRRIYADAAAAGVPYDKVIIIGSSWGGEQLISSSTYHLPYTTQKMQSALAATQSRFPGSTINKVIFIDHSRNDLQGGNSLSAVQAAMTTTVNTLAAVSGWSGAKIVGVGGTPEILALYDAKMEAATRIPVLSNNGYWVQFPSGLGQLHLGDGHTIAEVRTGGYDYCGRTASVALGHIAPTAPNFTLADNIHRTEGTSTAIPVLCDQPFYLSGLTAGASFLDISADLSYSLQVLQPDGNAFPAYDAGTPANNTKAYAVNYITGDRVTGNLARNLIIDQNVVIPYAVYDDFNRSTATDTFEAMGVTSGKNGYGGGKTWIADGTGNGCFVYNNRCRVSDGSFQQRGSFVDAGSALVDFRFTWTKGGGRPVYFYFAGAESAPGSGTFNSWARVVDTGAIQQLENGSFGGLGGLFSIADGQHDGRITVEAGGVVKFYVDNTLVMTRTLGSDTNTPWGLNTDRHFIGIGVEYNNSVADVDNLSVLIP